MVQVVSTTGKERYSTAFFMDADFDCVVDTADIPSCQVCRRKKVAIVHALSTVYTPRALLTCDVLFRQHEARTARLWASQYT